jgi:signal transduction histidine kinase
METPAGDSLLRETLKVLGEAMERSVIIVGPEGGLRHTNRAARTLLGWEGAEDVATRTLDTIPVASPIRTLLRQDPGPWEEETTIEVRGRMIPVLVAKRPIALGGRQAGSLVLMTDLREVSTAIADRDRARRNDRAKTRSLHMVAHDMSGAVTILNGYVSLVLDGTLPIEQLEPYMPILADQLQHMQRLLNVLLDTARMEEGSLELRLEPLDLARFVEDMVSRIRPPETGHQLVVRREVAELPIMADPIRLDSIVRNVVSNAIKYSPEGTAVTCTLRQDDGATLEVADEGMGIDDDDLHRLFTRFGRVGDLNANPPGVGLGLFLSRELARLHGGDLEVASEVGKGSRFTLRLPLRDAGTR